MYGTFYAPVALLIGELRKLKFTTRVRGNATNERLNTSAPSTSVGRHETRIERHDRRDRLGIILPSPLTPPSLYSSSHTCTAFARRSSFTSLPIFTGEYKKSVRSFSSTAPPSPPTDTHRPTRVRRPTVYHNTYVRAGRIYRRLLP